MTRIAAVALSLLLVASALALITSQYRARELFAQLEVAQQQAKALDADGSRLRSELGRVSQPAIVEGLARRLGMRAISPDRIVMLPVAATDMPSASGGSAKESR